MVEIIVRDPGNSSYNPAFQAASGYPPSIETSVIQFLRYFLPSITSFTIPLCLLNVFIMLKSGITESPSKLIYFNLIVLDFVNCLIGAQQAAHLWHAPQNRSRTNWSNNTVIGQIDLFAYIITFDGNIVLVFGLALLRVLWLEMSALSLIKRMILFSRCTVVAAYIFAVGCCLYTYLGHILEKQGPFPTKLIEAQDLLECLLIAAAIFLSLYTQARIWFHKKQIHQKVFWSASRTSFAITLSLTLCYSYYLGIMVVRLTYTHSHPGRDVRKFCDTSRDLKWWDVLLCDSIYVGITFMCLNGLLNNIILLSEKRARRFLECYARYRWREIKRNWEDTFYADYYD